MRPRRVPEEPEKDLLLFLAEHAPDVIIRVDRERRPGVKTCVVPCDS